MQLEPGDHKHYKKTTLTYLQGYAMDERPVYADLQVPSGTLRSKENPQKQDTKARAVGLMAERQPKWLENDRKVILMDLIR